MKLVKRGGAESDEKEFSVSSICKLKKAAEHIRYLINEGYALLLQCMDGTIRDLAGLRGTKAVPIQVW